MVGEPVLGQQRAVAAERRALDGDRVELTAPSEDVVDIVDDVGHHEAVDRRRAALRRGPSGGARQGRDGEDPGADRAQPKYVSSLHAAFLLTPICADYACGKCALSNGPPRSARGEIERATH